MDDLLSTARGQPASAKCRLVWPLVSALFGCTMPTNSVCTSLAEFLLQIQSLVIHAMLVWQKIEHVHMHAFCGSVCAVETALTSPHSALGVQVRQLHSADALLLSRLHYLVGFKSYHIDTLSSPRHVRLCLSAVDW